jgi:hypothetical protein
MGGVESTRVDCIDGVPDNTHAHVWKLMVTKRDVNSAAVTPTLFSGPNQHAVIARPGGGCHAQEGDWLARPCFLFV